MKKSNNYLVIGGQYQSYCYGGAATLAGAKRLATKNIEFWDNWQGWHKPLIYATEDCVECNNFFGKQMTPKVGALPVVVWNNTNNRWEEIRG